MDAYFIRSSASLSLSFFFFMTMRTFRYFVNAYNYSTCRRQSDFISWIWNCDISVIIVVVALAEVVVVVLLVVLVAFACSVARKSAWYKHNSPGVERVGTSSSGAGVRFGATPTSMLSRGAELLSHGIFAVTWPFLMEYGVVSYRCIKLFEGIVWSASKAK